MASVALTLALLAVGPAAADESPIIATGEVSVDGRPLADGKLIVHLDDGEFVGARIKDGRFRLTRVPAGEWRVAIQGDGLPEKYSSEDRTALRVRIVQGVNAFDFQLRK